MLDRALEAEPRCERNAAYEFLGNSGEIERNQSKSAALQDQVGGFENLIKSVLVMAASSYDVFGRWSSFVWIVVCRSSYFIRKVKIPTLGKERGRMGHPVL